MAGRRAAFDVAARRTAAWSSSRNTKREIGSEVPAGGEVIAAHLQIAGGRANSDERLTHIEVRTEILAKTQELMADSRTEILDKVQDTRTGILQKTQALVRDARREILDQNQELVRDAQTEILKAFLPYQETQSVRFQALEISLGNTTANVTARMAILERRLAEIEKRLLLNPPAA
jgi:hypothetical protein